MTDFFSSWCDLHEDEAVGTHVSRLLTSRDEDTGITAVAKLLPQTYAKPKYLEQIAKLNGKEGFAKILTHKVPQTKTGRSGDMGEVLATLYVRTTMDYVTGPSRLIERDHQEWALRGDDVLGLRLNGQELEIVKVEAKSRVRANKATIVEAREGLLRNDDLASPHSLTQFAERLLDDEEELSEALSALLLNNGLRPGHLTHIMFIFSGIHPANHIRDDLMAYDGAVTQMAVTVRVLDHQEFIRKSFESVVNNAP